MRVEKKFSSFGKESSIGNGVSGHLDHVSVGDHSYIGNNVYFNSLLANVHIGDHVMIADEVLFITGNHRTDKIGCFMSEVSNQEKNEKDDQDIVVERDVWIGSRAIILKGVTIHEGCVIGAGSIVTKDIPPYSIAVGNPAHVIRPRFSEEDLAVHKKTLRGNK